MEVINEKGGYIDPGLRWLKTLKDGAHPAFTYASNLQMAEILPEFVGRGLDENKINVLFVTQKQAEIYKGYLNESGIDSERLIVSRNIIVSPIDELVNERDVSAVITSVEDKVRKIGALATESRKRGLSIVGEIAGTFAAMERYEDCVMVEAFWHRFIPEFRPQITLVCPYQAIPSVLRGPLEELHNCVIPIQAVWEIVPASYTCVKCKRHVNKEIREYEPDLMIGQSEVITVSMKENEAGWIPFCFNCISAHPFLKPTWLRV